MTARGADEILLGLTVALRAAGVPVTHDRAAGFLAAAAAVGADDRRAVYLAGRATLCSSPDDLARYDQVFTAYVDAVTGLPRAVPATAPGRRVATTLPVSEPDPGDGNDAASDAADVVRARASAEEVLRHRDVAGLSASERSRLNALFGTLRPRPPLRRPVRRQPWHRGRVDAGRTMRESLRRMGEPSRIRWQERAVRPRRVVLLVDVSGSMSGYAESLLRLAHTLTQAHARAGGRVETFTLGTRLTHVTRALRLRDPERALTAAGRAVPDWSGGTRLGATLGAFHDRWGRRGLARGAVVVVFSDGWERGDASDLGEQARRIGAVAHRLVWVNPHRGKPGYEPVQQGVVAVLPHCDDFLAGHSLATFAELVEVIARA